MRRGKLFRTHFLHRCRQVLPGARHAAGLSYNLAAITGGAFAPIIVSALVMNFGIQTLGRYLGAMAVIALVALVFFRESKDVDFEQ